MTLLSTQRESQLRRLPTLSGSRLILFRYQRNRLFPLECLVVCGKNVSLQRVCHKKALPEDNMAQTETQRRGYAVGVQTFDRIRERGSVYIDKTAYKVIWRDERILHIWRISLFIGLLR